MQHQLARCCMPRNGLITGLPCAADYVACKLFFFCFNLVHLPVQIKKRGIAAHHLFEYKVTAVCLLMTIGFSAVNFANYVEYKLHFLALSSSTVNHATAPSIMRQCRC
jgi:hypothetical protein